MRRVLVDGESGVDVIFLDKFKKIGPTNSMIQRNVNPLVRFDGRASYLVGSIILLVTAAEKLLHIKFTIVDATSTYNIILGRSCIHKMEGIASTLYRLFKYRAVDRSEMAIIRGDQPMAKQCASFLLRRATKKEK